MRTTNFLLQSHFTWIANEGSNCVYLLYSTRNTKAISFSIPSSVVATIRQSSDKLLFLHLDCGLEAMITNSYNFVSEMFIDTKIHILYCQDSGYHHTCASSKYPNSNHEFCFYLQNNFFPHTYLTSHNNFVLKIKIGTFCKCIWGMSRIFMAAKFPRGACLI